eukprot:gene11635-biopygen9304
MKGDICTLDRQLRGQLRKARYIDGAAATVRHYLPRKLGGRGRPLLEELYFNTILGLVSYLGQPVDEFGKMLRQCLLAFDRPGHRHQTVIGKARQVFTQLDLTAQFIVDEQGLHPPGDTSGHHRAEYKTHVRNYFQTRTEKTLSSHTVNARYYHLLQDELIDKALAHAWLVDGFLRPQTEGFIAAIQDGKLLIKANSTKATGTCTPRCRLCGQAPETISHIISSCTRHHHSAYKLRHDQALKPVLNGLLETMVMDKQICGERSDPKPEYESGRGRMLWEVMVQPDHRAHRPDMMVYDTEQRIITVVELTESTDCRKYRSLVADLGKAHAPEGWRYELLVIVVGALCTMTVPMTSGLTISWETMQHDAMEAMCRYRHVN